MSVAYEQGEGVEKDWPKAGDLSLEAFNRVIACCAAQVAVNLLNSENKYDRETVRRTAHELLLRAAALGSAEAHTELARLYEAGTLARPADAKITPKIASYEHRAIAVKIASSQSSPGPRGDAPAVPTPEGLAPDELAGAKAYIEAWKPAGYDTLPPWLEPASPGTAQPATIEAKNRTRRSKHQIGAA